MKEQVNQRIIIPCTITVVESFEETGTDNSLAGVKIKGKLITCGVPTRNGISYTRESMQKFVNTFNQAGATMPFLDSHDDSSIRKNPPFGHITKLSMSGNDVGYEADIDPEEKPFLRKLKRGDIREVSLQAIVDSVGEQEALDGGQKSVMADVRELLEVSSVLIPGARGTSMEMEESFGFMSEQRFVETFRNARHKGITFKESYRFLLKEHYSTKEAQDDAKVAGGTIVAPKKVEDLTTANGGALIAPQLPKNKKIKKIERLAINAQFLKIITRRID